MSNREGIKSKVRQWIRFAGDDLRLARHSLTLSSGCPYRLVAYHAQQCAEKYLKALLVFDEIDFPYTHNISRLIELCQADGEWKKSILEAEELTVFAITTRYPGEDDDVTLQEANRSILLAERVAAAVSDLLAARGVDILPRNSQPPAS